jgi:ribosomal protein L29
MMNPKDLRQKTRDELARLATDSRATIRDLRFKIATRQYLKVRAVRNAKKDLARVLTALKGKTE